MKTTASDNPVSAFPDAGHFHPGDHVMSGGIDPTGGESWYRFTISECTVTGGRPRFTAAGGTWAGLDGLRHDDQLGTCDACQQDIERQRQQMAGPARDYWSHWSAAAHARYEQISVHYATTGTHACGHGTGRGTFTTDSPIPAWLRRATAGLLTPPESPTLAVARLDALPGQFDWHQIAHHADVHADIAAGAGHPAVHWHTVLAVLDDLAAAGDPAGLSTEIEITPAGGLAITVYDLYIDTARPGAITPEHAHAIGRRLGATYLTPGRDDLGPVWTWGC